MSLAEACEYLRSALHFLAIAGADIQVENTTAAGLQIGIREVAMTEDASGDIFFVPISPLQNSIASGIAAAA